MSAGLPVLPYEDFLLSKVRVAKRHGIEVAADRLHPSTKPEQRDIILWDLLMGRALVAPDCGRGKSHMAIETCRILFEEFGGKCLIVTELGAAETFINQDPAVGEGARLGVSLEYVTNQQEAFASSCHTVITNYERVRDGRFDFSGFTCVWLDEGNYLKNMASETTNALQAQLKGVKFKYIATATPSPNETLELVNYAHVLEIADRGQILTQYFQRNPTKAGDLTLHPQHEADFWLWVHSWMVAIEKPSDLGYSDAEDHIPELEVVWHEVKINKAIDAGTEKDGQMRLVNQCGNSLPDNARIKRESIAVRLDKVMELVAKELGSHFIIWHHLEDERKALSKAFKERGYSNDVGYGDIYGSMPEKLREQRVVAFTKGDLQILGTKPELNAVGCNFQKHCNRAIVMGINNDWDSLYQLMKRIWRPWSPFSNCRIYIIYTPEEYPIVQNLKRKWNEHNAQRTWLRNIVRKHGLGTDGLIAERRRTLFSNRQEFKGDKFTLVVNDAVPEWRKLADNSVDMILTSFPFGNHYEYTDTYNDFGHNSTNKDFFRQMDYLIPEMLRALKPGRIAAIDLKNRIHYGSVTGKGFSTFHRFTHATCDAMEKHGFETMGFHYIPTDVVAENNQTYRLTYGEMQKDSTKMGSGIPEEIWIFRKPPTSSANAYADESVDHNCECPHCGHRDVAAAFIKNGSLLLQCPLPNSRGGCRQFFLYNDLIKHSEYEISLPQWQIDADSFWRSSGNRYLTPEEIATWDIKKLRKWWDKFNANTVYNFEEHVKLLTEIDASGHLSKTFTTLPLRSNTEFIWNDVNRMQGLNLQQRLRKKQNHICPMPFDKVDRCIELYSNDGDLIADSFAGLCTTGIRAIRKGRRAFLTELNATYGGNGYTYLKEEEQKRAIPTLFDFLPVTG